MFLVPSLTFLRCAAVQQPVQWGALDSEFYFPPEVGRVYRKPRAAGARFSQCAGVCVGLALAGPFCFDTSDVKRLSIFLLCHVAGAGRVAASPRMEGCARDYLGSELLPVLRPCSWLASC